MLEEGNANLDEFPRIIEWPSAVVSGPYQMARYSGGMHAWNAA